MKSSQRQCRDLIDRVLAHVGLKAVFTQGRPNLYDDPTKKCKADKELSQVPPTWSPGLDAFLFFKAEAVRYITEFHVKGFCPFMEPEYVVLVAKGRAPAVGYISGRDDLRIRFKSNIEDAAGCPRSQAGP